MLGKKSLFNDSRGEVTLILTAIAIIAVLGTLFLSSGAMLVAADGGGGSSTTTTVTGSTTASTTTDTTTSSSTTETTTETTTTESPTTTDTTTTDTTTTTTETMGCNPNGVIDPGEQCDPVAQIGCGAGFSCDTGCNCLQNPTTTTTTTATTSTETVPTTTTTTTTTTSTTTTCSETLVGAVVPAQVVYVDDPAYSTDLSGDYPYLTVQSTLPMIHHKPTGLVGIAGDDFIARAKITAGSEEINGKFTIEIEGGSPSLYTSTKDYHVDACQTVEFKLNPHTSDNAVSGIPFVPGSSALVPGTSDIQWTPLQYVQFDDSAAVITLKFAGKELGQTIIAKAVPSVPFRVEWKPINFKDETLASDKAIIAEAKQRSTGYPAEFIKATYPVQDDLFKASAPSFSYLKFENGSITKAFFNRFNESEQDFILMRYANDQYAAMKASNQADRILLVAPEGMLAPGVRGATYGGAKVEYVKVGAPESVDAHEIGHSKPWKITYDEYLSDPPDGIPSIGYLATFLQDIKGSPPRPFIGSLQAQTLGFMGRGDSSFFRTARKNQYRDFILRHFDATVNTKLDPKVWVLRAVLNLSGPKQQLIVSPIYVVNSTDDNETVCDANDTNCVDLTIKTTLPSDAVRTKHVAVDTVSQKDEGTSTATQIYFPVSLATDLPGQGVKSIAIKSGNKVLYALNVSAHTPNLNIKPINVTDKKAKIIIKANDEDNNTMFAMLLIQNSTGYQSEIETDRLIDDDKEKFTFKTNDLLPGNYTAIAYVTDGFNTIRKDEPFTVF